MGVSLPPTPLLWFICPPSWSDPVSILCYICDPFLTVISRLLAPGQVHTISTVLQPTEELTLGAIMYGSQFLSGHCMLLSLLSSWVDHISQDSSHMEFAWSETITTCLVAMVSKAWKDLVRGHPQVHEASPEDTISLTSMALLFIGNDHKEKAHQEAQDIISSPGMYF